MVRIRRQSTGILLLAAGLALASGCFGVTQNPSYFPYLLPTEDIIQTHAKPPGFGYFSNFDPHACRLEVRPLDATNPVQTQHVLIATVYDEKGEPRRNRRVEWMVEGVGNIVEVDESGYFPGRGYKVDNKYAVSYTDYIEHKITRGNANPNDDFVIRPGQTWCVISSAVEGDTHVTVYAPEIANWDAHKVFVTKHWVDAEWTMPPPAVNRSGAEHVITTNVFRHTDHQPLANYRVRYRIIDGPPALFLPSRTQEAVAISDLSGNASVALAQVAPQPGINRINVEIIRPPDPWLPSGAGIVIGRGETTMEWLAPAIALAKTGPPAVAVGQEIAYTLTLTNTGRVETQAQTLHDAIPEGFQYVRSQPPAVVEGNQLTWTLGVLPGGQSHAVQAVFRSLRVGPVTNCANVTTLEGLHAESCATTQITAPQLTVAMIGPAAAVVGVPIPYQITLANPGTGPATNVLLTDDFDPGLEHDSHANPVELRLGALAPGETKNVPLSLTPRQVGRFVNRVTAVADGNLRAHAEHPVVVALPQLTLTITGPKAPFVDRPAKFEIRVANAGDVPLTSVVVRDDLPPELGYTSADSGASVQGQTVVWNLGALQPKEQHAPLTLVTRCLTLSPRVVNVATATADPGVQVRAEAALEIRGVPAFRLEMFDKPDPVEVGSNTTYTIHVTNQGSLPGNQVEITALVPPRLQVVNATGPSKPRFEPGKVIFPPVDGLAPKQVLEYTVEAKALQAGDIRFRVELRAATLKEPVIEEESTNVIPAEPGSAPAAPPGGAPRVPSPQPGSSAPPAPAPGTFTPPPAPQGAPTTPPSATRPAPAPAAPPASSAVPSGPTPVNPPPSSSPTPPPGSRT